MEFGSDFHILSYPKGDSFFHHFPNSNLYASGRQALMALAIARNWRKLWIPSYFCKESLNYLRTLETELVEYNCIPTADPIEVVKRIPANKNDGILVVNYFGLHNLKNFNVEAEIVEDHTHDLIGEWAQFSSADWCIASLRKTIPIADGGILWSPLGYELPPELDTTQEIEKVIGARYEAMEQKALYLKGIKTDKSVFLRNLIKSEEKFANVALSGISKRSYDVLGEFDIVAWYDLKRNNHKLLMNEVIIPKGVTLLKANAEKNTSFSFCLLFDKKEQRDYIRQYLIAHSVYPAILWSIDSLRDIEAKRFGDRILSIHCDGRYDNTDTLTLASILNSIL